MRTNVRPLVRVVPSGNKLRRVRRTFLGALQSLVYLLARHRLLHGKHLQGALTVPNEVGLPLVSTGVPQRRSLDRHRYCSL